MRCAGSACHGFHIVAATATDNLLLMGPQRCAVLLLLTFIPTVLPDLYLSSHSTSGDMTVMLINRGTASVMLQAKNSTARILSKMLPLLAGRNPAQHRHGH